MRVRTTVRVLLSLVTIALIGGGVVQAQVSDLSTTTDGPEVVASGDLANITLGYANAGPNTPLNAYANAYLPSGVPAPLGELTQAQVDALIASMVPDGLGNTGYLFADTTFCEHLLFQVQENIGPSPGGLPMIGLGAGASDAVSFDLEIPMEPPELGALIIDEPASLVREYKPAIGGVFEYAADWGRYTRGTCDPPPPDCVILADCFAPRVSNIEPIEADFELVSDGTADPTFGCATLTGFTPGNIAVIRRGGCEFGTKGVNAQNAGASAAIIVNDDRCLDISVSTRCAIYMGAGVDGGDVVIPLIQLAADDGEPIIDALVAATTVRGRLGPVSSTLTLDGEIFLVDPLSETDPDPVNNFSAQEVDVSGIFFDGFETGDTMEWSNAVP